MEKPRANFYFPGNVHSLSSSYSNLQLLSAQPFLPQRLLLGRLSAVLFPRLRESQFHSYLLCFFFFLLIDSSEQLLNAAVLYVKATHTLLPCCLFRAWGKTDGSLVRQYLHFNQASEQSGFLPVWLIYHLTIFLIRFFSLFLNRNQANSPPWAYVYLKLITHPSGLSG